jgi:hypothetical protein
LPPSPHLPSPHLPSLPSLPSPRPRPRPSPHPRLRLRLRPAVALLKWLHGFKLKTTPHAPLLQQHIALVARLIRQLGIEKGKMQS